MAGRKDKAEIVGKNTGNINLPLSSFKYERKFQKINYIKASAKARPVEAAQGVHPSEDPIWSITVNPQKPHEFLNRELFTDLLTIDTF